MSSKIIVPGYEIETGAKTEPALQDFGLNVRTEHSVRITEPKRGKADFLELDGAEDDDIVEIELEYGVREWVRVEHLRQRLQQIDPKLVEANRLNLAPSLEQRSSRGVVSWTLKGLKLLKIDPIDPIANAAAAKMVEYIEDKFFGKPGVKPPGLYSLSATGQLAAPIKTSLPAEEAPFLIFLHGTASSTLGSFGKLFDADPTDKFPQPTAEWNQLQNIYRDRLLALEHRTLSLNPAQNALELVRLLPRQAKVHLVSHSRGGLVGELLCRGPLSTKDLTPFAVQNRTTDLEILRELGEELRDKQLQIERFVRVACPARGTLLASERIDTYFSILLNLIGLIPALRNNPIYEFVQATLIAIVKKRSDPAAIPGLEAMIPTSPFIKLVNPYGVKVNANLTVIAGDVQSKGVFGLLKDMAINLFFREDNDLVVNTASMYQGLERAGGARFWFDHGPEVNHFSYFSNESSRRRVFAGLTQPEKQLEQVGFQLLTRQGIPELDRGALRAKQTDAPVVFVIPGLMATHLKDEQERLWLNAARLADGQLDQLALNGAASNGRVVADEIIAANYQQLLEHLTARYEVIDFPYDWRQSALTTGQRLAAVVGETLRQRDKPVHLLAHSTGGLVARAMLLQDRAVWQQLCDRGGRLVMLGVPQHGSFEVLRLLAGQSGLAGMLALLDPSREPADLSRIMLTWPGLLELLPDLPGSNFWEVNWWQQAGIKGADTAAFAQALEAARQVRAKLAEAAAIDANHMVCVLGSAPLTASGVRPNETGGLRFRGSALGDGFAPHRLATLADTPTWYMPAGHGEMTRYQPAFPALVELFEQGHTGQLALKPPVPELDTLVDLPQSELVLFPTEAELVAAALYNQTATADKKDYVTLRIAVTHGSLEFARHPVAVGHYYGDLIVGAEKFLDQKLNGRLLDRFNLNLYTGADNSSEVILAPNCSPKGALIIGLGEIGELTPEKITTGIREAALRLALEVAEQPEWADSSGGWRSAAFSTVLIGTNGGRALNIESSIAAIVKGAMLANRLLQNRGLWDRVRIDQIEFIELYQDLATHAAHVIRNINNHVRLLLEKNEEIIGSSYLHLGHGGLQGRPGLQYDQGWWRRLQITGATATDPAKKARALNFLMLTDRARAEETLQATQANLIDGFIQEAITNPNASGDLPATLYELLMPNTLKEQAEETANLVLVLDSHAAQYPWEMLVEPTKEREMEPLAIRIGVLRQLKTVQFRPKVQPPRGNRALVIGNPKLGVDSPYPDLPGAEDEARLVKAELERHGYDVTLLVGEQAHPTAVLNALFTREYRLLHIAGHGSYNPDSPAESGVVIGDNIHLTANEIRQLRVVPDLVFLNCCHLGQIDQAAPGKVAALRQTERAWNKLAASISAELINIGVRGVIAAGWAVNDAAAKTFAAEFYGQIMFGQGRQFGQAIHEARKKTYEKHRATNTWGAYQCYGDPGFVLETGARSATGGGLEPVAGHEVVKELRDIKASVAAGSPAQRKASLERVRELQRNLRHEWYTGELLYHLGETFGELGAFDEAIYCYEQGVKSWGGDVPIRMVEQLGNLKARYAVQLKQQERRSEPGAARRADRPEPDKLLEEASAWLKWVLAAGPTPERLALMGSFYKRAALATEGKGRSSSLKKAEEYYQKAHQLSKSTGKIEPYYSLNWVTIRFLKDCAGKDEAQQKELVNEINLCLQVTTAKADYQADFWSRVAVPDANLLLALIRGNLADREEEIARLYHIALGAWVTARERASVQEQFDFLIELLTGSDCEHLLAPLRRIRTAIAE